MARFGVLNRVKTNEGYDILNPLIPWSVQNCIFQPTSTASIFVITTNTPSENLDDKCIALFAPTMANSAGVMISVNGAPLTPIMSGGAPLEAGTISANQITMIIIDFTNNSVFLNIPVDSRPEVINVNLLSSDWIPMTTEEISATDPALTVAQIVDIPNLTPTQRIIITAVPVSYVMDGQPLLWIFNIDGVCYICATEAPTVDVDATLSVQEVVTI